MTNYGTRVFRERVDCRGCMSLFSLTSWSDQEYLCSVSALGAGLVNGIVLVGGWCRVGAILSVLQGTLNNTTLCSLKISEASLFSHALLFEMSRHHYTM